MWLRPALVINDSKEDWRATGVRSSPLPAYTSLSHHSHSSTIFRSLLPFPLLVLSNQLSNRGAVNTDTTMLNGLQGVAAASLKEAASGVDDTLSFLSNPNLYDRRRLPF